MKLMRATRGRTLVFSPDPSGWQHVAGRVIPSRPRLTDDFSGTIHLAQLAQGCLLLECNGPIHAPRGVLKWHSGWQDRAIV
jgi:hypothetical protein